MTLKNEPEQCTYHVTLQLEGKSIGVRADHPGFISFLCEYFDGFADFTNSASTEGWWVSFMSDDRTYREMEAMIARISGPSQDENSEELNREGDADIVAQRLSDKMESFFFSQVDFATSTVKQAFPRSDPFAWIEGVRTIRNLCELMLLRRGMVPFHASALAGQAGAVCMTGPKFSGKTTSLLVGLLYGGLDFMANDKIFVFEKAGRFFVRALPIAAGIRVGTLQLFEPLAPIIQEFNSMHCENWPLNDERLTDPQARVYVEPPRLVRLLGCRVSAAAPLVCVVAPCYRPSAVEIAPRQIKAAAANQLLQEQYLADFFPHQPYWHAGLHDDQEVLRRSHRELIERVASEVPICEISQNLGLNAEVRRTLGVLASSGYRLS